MDGRPSADLSLTSKYTWFYGSYPFTNNPADLHGHHMYDDVRTTFGRTLPAGARVRFEIADPPVPVTIDVADFEYAAPPAAQPRGSLSVLSFGADATGKTDSTAAIQDAINAGSQQHRAVYLPPGEFTVTAHLMVNDVTLTGAGDGTPCCTEPASASTAMRPLIPAPRTGVRREIEAVEAPA